MPNLAMISQNYNSTGDTPILDRRNYVEVVKGKPKKPKDARPEQRLCDHLKPAIHADGMEKGRLVKICANTDCKVHFPNRQREEEQRLQFKAEKKAANRKGQADYFLSAPPYGRCSQTCEATLWNGRIADGSVLHVALPATRTGVPPGEAAWFAKSESPRDYQMAEKARTLYRKADTAGLAVLVFEAMLLGSVQRTAESKDDDPLSVAASLFKIDTKALRASIAKGGHEKARKKAKKRQVMRSQSLRRNSVASKITEKWGCPSQDAIQWWVSFRSSGLNSLDTVLLTYTGRIVDIQSDRKQFEEKYDVGQNLKSGRGANRRSLRSMCGLLCQQSD
jgi:ParB family transcriptional regulator, chromosome partitioning protein